MRTTLKLVTLATALLAGCSDIPHCGGSPASKERFDCEAKYKREFDAFHKKQNGEPLTLKGALKEEDPLCFKNPRPGERACTTIESTGK